MRIKILAMGLACLFLSIFIFSQETKKTKFLNESDSVYYNFGEKIFHINNCPKLMKNRTGISLKFALKRGFKACPECILSKGIRIAEKISSTIQNDIENRRKNYVKKHPELSPKIKKAILNGNILIGMTGEQVRASRGRPYKINKTTTASKIHEQWIMHPSGYKPGSFEADKDKEYGYIYFDNGKVTGWQSW